MAMNDKTEEMLQEVAMVYFRTLLKYGPCYVLGTCWHYFGRSSYIMSSSKEWCVNKFKKGLLSILLYFSLERT